MNKQRFIYNTYESLTNEPIYERYSDKKHPIKGVKVNMKRYNILLKTPKEKILSIYFDKDKNLKKQYEKILHEIIAVCYTNNVKVITPINGTPYYEVFK